VVILFEFLQHLYVNDSWSIWSWTTVWRKQHDHGSAFLEIIPQRDGQTDGQERQYLLQRFAELIGSNDTFFQKINPLPKYEVRMS